MASEASFDVVSKVDRQEVDNALNQAAKEIAQRYDFKGVGASIAWSGEKILMIANSSERVLADPRRVPDQADPARHLAEVAGHRRRRRPRAQAVRQGVPPRGPHQGGPEQRGRQEGRPRSSATRGPRASRRRSRATSCASRARAATTCRPSSRCSRAPTSTSPCSSPTTADAVRARWSRRRARVRSRAHRARRRRTRARRRSVPRDAVLRAGLALRRAMRSAIGGWVAKSRRHAGAAERVRDHEVRDVDEVAVLRQRRAPGCPSRACAARTRARAGRR